MIGTDTTGPFTSHTFCVYTSNMGSQLRSKQVRLTLFSVSFFLLFAFWLVALYCGLRGGLTTYALLLVAVVVILSTNRTKST